PSHPRLTFRDDRDTPLLMRRGRLESVMLRLANDEAKYFSPEGWTMALSGGAVICPSGNFRGNIALCASERHLAAQPVIEQPIMSEPVPETASATVSQRTDIRALTGVRGVAAAIIVIYHYGKFRLHPDAEIWSVPHGYLPVDLFFMLSGF